MTPTPTASSSSTSPPGSAASSRSTDRLRRSRGGHRRLPALLLATASLFVAGCGACGAQEPAAEASAAAPAAETGELARFGDGFLVWESNRTGDWRLWTRHLDGTGLARLTPEEDGRQHLAPHISPDGRRLVYLAAGREARDRFPEGGLVGELRLRELGPPPGSGEAAEEGAAEAGAERVLARVARGYGDDRVAVWVDDRRLVYIDGDGHTILLDLESGERETLTAEPMAEHGRLIDPTLSWGTTALPTFSPYDRAARTLVERSPIGGCEPYFSADGRWGFWIAGAGGPIQKIELATRRIGSLVDKGDPRLPADRGYLYFPMLSRNSRLLAFAASGDEHDHFRGDYDVFVAEVDPETLELVGAPARFTEDPHTDRFPDVWQAPLPLGRHAGEAPFTLALEAPPELAAGGPFDVDFGDGETARGTAVEHTWEEPGVYRLVAERGDGTRLVGRVTVRPAAPPRAVGVEVRRAGHEVVVEMDEALAPLAPAGSVPEEGEGDGEEALSRPEVRFASGREVAGLSLGEEGRSLVVRLAEPLTGADRITVSGLVDRARRPNRMQTAELEIDPPAWPASREELVFLWRDAEAPNLVWDPRLESERASTFTAHGPARHDHYFRLRPAGGFFRAADEAAGWVVRRTEEKNQVTIEATITAPTEGVAPGEAQPILSLGQNRRNVAFLLAQRGDRLVMRMLTPETKSAPELDLFALPSGEPVHVALTYVPGRLVVYRDGERVKESALYRGGLARWRRWPLTVGSLGDGGPGGGWDGVVEALAIYARELPAAEVRENHLRRRAEAAKRPDVPRAVVEARLAERTPTPTLREISPYREALAVYEWEVLRRLEGGELAGIGEGDRLRVAHWVILDAEELPVTGLEPGATRRLAVERFADNPQLESRYTADTLPEDWEAVVFFAVESGGGR